MLRIILAGLHLLALGLGMMAVVLRGSALKEKSPTIESLHRAFRMDTFWGVAAGLWLVTGLWRLFGHTEKATAYYFANRVFLMKMVLLVVIFALEVWPMIRLLKARVALRNGLPPAMVVDPAAARRIALIGHVQATLLLVMIFAAVAMARGYGLTTA
jgi:putative membrane protein